MMPKDGSLRYTAVSRGTAEEEPVKESGMSSLEVGGEPGYGGITDTKGRRDQESGEPTDSTSAKRPIKTQTGKYPSGLTI